MERHIKFATIKDFDGGIFQSHFEFELKCWHRIMDTFNNHIIPFRNIKINYERRSYKWDDMIHIIWYISTPSVLENGYGGLARFYYPYNFGAREYVKKHTRIRKPTTRSWILKKMYTKKIGKQHFIYGIIEQSESPPDISEIVDTSWKLTMNKIPYDELRLSREELHREYYEWYYAPSRFQFFSDDD